jgi:hypothetical protein
MTRATVKLDLLVRAGNPFTARFLDAAPTRRTGLSPIRHIDRHQSQRDKEPGGA